MTKEIRVKNRRREIINFHFKGENIMEQEIENFKISQIKVLYMVASLTYLLLPHKSV